MSLAFTHILKIQPIAKYKRLFIFSFLKSKKLNRIQECFYKQFEICCYLFQVSSDIYKCRDFLPMEDRQAYFETARLLLEAESITTGPNDWNPLDLLLGTAILDKAAHFQVFVEHICLSEESLLLIADLLELLLKHGAQPTSKRGDFTYNMIIIKLAAELSTAVDTPERLNYLSLTSDQCRISIGILGGRHASLSAACWVWTKQY